MGTTTNYSLPYPELTDEPDGAAQIQALATAVDTELDALQTAIDAIPDDGGGGGGPDPTDAVGGRFVNTGAQSIPVTSSGPGTPAAFPSAGANTPGRRDQLRLHGGLRRWPA
jgi:hypothetical protein